MMIKCQKCGFENQMGSIFCRDCGEKLDMDAIDPNKLQKDVNKEKNIKLAKKRIKGAISAGITLLVIGLFIFIILWGGGSATEKFKVKDAAAERSEEEVAAEKKFNSVLQGKTLGTTKYSYDELNYMIRDNIVKPYYELDIFAKPYAVEVSFNEKKNKPVIKMWLMLKSVKMCYTIYGIIDFTAFDPEKKDAEWNPIKVKVDRLDIGLLPLHLTTRTFLNGFTNMIETDAVRNFFKRAQTVEFNNEGVTIEFVKGAPVATETDSDDSQAQNQTPGASAARKIPSVAGVEQKNADRNKQIQSEATKSPSSAKSSTKSNAKSSPKAPAKSEEEIAKEEERKRKAEEYRQQQREKEEERKRKAEEEKERKKQEAEERKRRQQEENERIRQENEERRRNRNNNNYNNNSRSSRNSRNNRW